MVNTGCNQEVRDPPWADLPTELIELILENCNFSDQARLRAVCRRWQSIPRVQPRTQKLPWLMAFNNRNWSRFKLFDISYNRTYIINISSIVKEYFQEMNPEYIRICACKSGWLLLSHFVDQSSNTAFILYNPFTNRMIKLPNLQTSYMTTATFTTEPTSEDCVFFVLDNSIHANTIAASTCHLGDTTWATHVFPGSFIAINNAVYSQGLFWCVTDRGRLATFSIAQGIWNVLESPLLSHAMHDQTYMVESNGNLLLVLTARLDKLIHAFKLDSSQMAWIRVEDIGDQTLCLGPTSLSVSSVPAKLGIAGTIHCGWSRGRNMFRFRPKHYGSPKLWIEPPS